MIFKLQCTAWERRQERPIVLIQTFPSSDPMIPRVTILPWREHVKTGFARTHPESTVNLKALLGCSCGDPTKPTANVNQQYYIALKPDHLPGLGGGVVTMAVTFPKDASVGRDAGGGGGGEESGHSFSIGRVLTNGEESEWPNTRFVRAKARQVLEVKTAENGGKTAAGSTLGDMHSWMAAAWRQLSPAERATWGGVIHYYHELLL